MELIWPRGPTTAEQLREALAPKRRLKESTVRTVLRRLEEKGYLTHRVEGRTYVYSSSEPAQSVAARAVRQIIDRFCGGSVEQLLAGMVDNEVLDERELRRLAGLIARRKSRKGEE
jgi:predicted transcriptional regulator